MDDSFGKVNEDGGTDGGERHERAQAIGDRQATQN